MWYLNLCFFDLVRLTGRIIFFIGAGQVFRMRPILTLATNAMYDRLTLQSRVISSCQLKQYYMKEVKVVYVVVYM